MSGRHCDETGCAAVVLGFFLGMAVAFIFVEAQKTHDYIKALEKENAEFREKATK